MLATVLQFMFPDATRDSWEVRDDGDGPYISRWDHTEPEPSIAELLAVRKSGEFVAWYQSQRATKAARQEARENVRKTRIAVVERLAEIKNRADVAGATELRAMVAELAGILGKLIEATV